jgi:hypothetical protein
VLAPDHGRFVVRKNDLVCGLVVVAVGVVFLASNLGLMPLWEVWHLWPLTLIVIGGAKVLFPEQGSRASGLPLLLVGGIFLAHNYHVLHIRDSWPLFVVSAGLGILASGWENSRRGPGGQPS